MKMKKKLEKSKEWEKGRRDKLNVAFHDLCKLLPDHDPSVTLSKMDILRKAAEYIKHLQELNEEIIKCGKDEAIRNETERLKKRVAQLLMKTKELVDALRAAGISIPVKNKKKKQKSPKRGNTSSNNNCDIVKKTGVSSELVRSENNVGSEVAKTAMRENKTHQKKLIASEGAQSISDGCGKKKVKCGCEKKTPKSNKPLSEVNASVSATSTMSCPPKTSTDVVITPAQTILNPLVPTNIQTIGADKSVLSSTLGPGTLIFKDGRIISVPPPSTPIIPQIVVKPQPAVILMQRPLTLTKKDGKNPPLLLPKKRDVTKTTFANKAPIPAIKTFRLESYPRTFKSRAKKPKESASKNKKDAPATTPIIPTTSTSVTTTSASITAIEPEPTLIVENGEEPPSDKTQESLSQTDIEKDPMSSQSVPKHSIDALFSKSSESADGNDSSRTTTEETTTSSKQDVITIAAESPLGASVTDDIAATPQAEENGTIASVEENVMTAAVGSEANDETPVQSDELSTGNVQSQEASSPTTVTIDTPAPAQTSATISSESTVSQNFTDSNLVERMTEPNKLTYDSPTTTAVTSESLTYSSSYTSSAPSQPSTSEKTSICRQLFSDASSQPVPVTLPSSSNNYCYTQNLVQSQPQYPYSSCSSHPFPDQNFLHNTPNRNVHNHSSEIYPNRSCPPCQLPESDMCTFSVSNIATNAPPQITSVSSQGPAESFVTKSYSHQRKVSSFDMNSDAHSNEEFQSRQMPHSSHSYTSNFSMSTITTSQVNSNMYSRQSQAHHSVVDTGKPTVRSSHQVECDFSLSNNRNPGPSQSVNSAPIFINPQFLEPQKNFSMSSLAASSAQSTSQPSRTLSVNQSVQTQKSFSMSNLTNSATAPHNPGNSAFPTSQSHAQQMSFPPSHTGPSVPQRHHNSNDPMFSATNLYGSQTNKSFSMSSIASSSHTPNAGPTSSTPHEFSSQSKHNAQENFSMNVNSSKAQNPIHLSQSFLQQPLPSQPHKSQSLSLGHTSMAQNSNSQISTASSSHFSNVTTRSHQLQKNFSMSHIAPSAVSHQVNQNPRDHYTNTSQLIPFSMSNITPNVQNSLPASQFSVASNQMASQKSFSINDSQTNQLFPSMNQPMQTSLQKSRPEFAPALSAASHQVPKSTCMPLQKPSNSCNFSMSSLTTNASQSLNSQPITDKPCEVMPTLADPMTSSIMEFNSNSHNKTAPVSVISGEKAQCRDKLDKHFSTNTEGNSFKPAESICSSDYLRSKDIDRNTFIPIIDDVRLNSEFSNDLFSSLQVPTGGTHSDSISPTAAFLLAFPLVSTSKNTDNLVESENQENQTSTPTTILQIGNIDPPSSEVFQPMEFGKGIGNDYIQENIEEKCKRKEVNYKDPKQQKKNPPPSLSYPQYYSSAPQNDYSAVQYDSSWTDPNKTKQTERKKREKNKNFNATYEYYRNDKNKKSKISVNWMAVPETQESDSTFPATNMQFPMDIDNFPDLCVSKKNNSYNWSPNKSLFPLESGLVIPSTLPTLVGDLALGTSTPSDSYKRYEKKTPDKEEKRPQTKNQANFLSVSQLVDPKSKKQAQTKSLQQSSERQYNKKQEKKKTYTSQTNYQKRKDPVVDPCMYTDNFLTGLSWDKQRYKGNYSAESLIGPHEINESVNFNYQQSNYFQNTEFNHETGQSGQYSNSFNFSQTQFTSFVNEEYQSENTFSSNNGSGRSLQHEKRSEPRCRGEVYQSSGFLQTPPYPSSAYASTSNLVSQSNFSVPPTTLNNFNITSNTTTSLTNFNLSTIFPEMNERSASSGQGQQGSQQHLTNFPGNQNYRNHPL